MSNAIATGRLARTGDGQGPLGMAGDPGPPPTGGEPPPTPSPVVLSLSFTGRSWRAGGKVGK